VTAGLAICDWRRYRNIFLVMYVLISVGTLALELIFIFNLLKVNLAVKLGSGFKATLRNEELYR
jgi:hypothetical protein